jgi:putative ABC transport system permease protein
MAFRNLGKNRRRSFFTIVAIGLGFAAVNVFGGFTSYIFASLRDSHIYAQGNGHLTIFKRGFLTAGKLDPARYLLSATELGALTEAARGFPEVALVTPQLHISGLLSNGEVSTVFLAAGRVPTDLRLINTRAQGMIGRLDLFSGRALQDDHIYGVGLSTGLAQQLHLGLDANAIAMAPTIDGQINALDVQVWQLFESPVEVLNDKLMLVPLAFAQTLYDTNGADRLTVLLQDTALTEPMRVALTHTLLQQGTEVEIRTWEELSLFYTKVKNMFDIIFLFLFLIVFVIAAMSIINTISMAVMERTREIGTLRALGVKRRRIVYLFALESATLGALGSLLGLVLTLLAWLFVKGLQPTWIPPIITKRIPLEVHLVPEYLLWSMAFLILLAGLAAVFPARRAAYQTIVDALGHA